MSGPLKGYRVLELTSTVSGPFAAMMLADQGADVIKVEPPGIGDLARVMGTMKQGVGAMFSVLNRNKRCVCLDLKNPEEIKILKDLIKDADVLIENYRPGVVKKLGIDYESVSKINPKIVYTSISGYGQSGPYQNRKVYDPLIQATTGIAHAQNKEKPELVRTIIYDKVTALTAAQAITSALLQKEREGKGQFLSISMMESALYYNWPDMMMTQTFFEGGEQIGELADLFEIYETKDGAVMIILIATDEVFTKFCNIYDLNLHKDERFINPAARVINQSLLTPLVNEATKKLSSNELVNKLDEEEIPASIVNKIDQVYKDEQVLSQESLVEINHPELGKMRMPKPPATFIGQNNFPSSLAPILGADTREVLTELGVEEKKIQSMEEREKANKEIIEAMMAAEESNS
jgi:crotonobetainyl-CoA:carnitine CoA-transferase CaiB-like acyl-CoA transferase